MFLVGWVLRVLEEDVFNPQLASSSVSAVTSSIIPISENFSLKQGT